MWITFSSSSTIRSATFNGREGYSTGAGRLKRKPREKLTKINTLIQVYRTYKPWFNYSVMIIYVIQSVNPWTRTLATNCYYKKIIKSLLSAQVWQEMNQSGQKYSKVISKICGLNQILKGVYQIAFCCRSTKKDGYFWWFYPQECFPHCSIGLFASWGFLVFQAPWMVSVTKTIGIQIASNHLCLEGETMEGCFKNKGSFLYKKKVTLFTLSLLCFLSTLKLQHSVSWHLIVGHNIWTSPPKGCFGNHDFQVIPWTYHSQRDFLIGQMPTMRPNHWLTTKNWERWLGDYILILLLPD